MSATFVIAQGGGPTAVINQTLVGAVIAARQLHRGCRVLGALHGVRGIRDGRFVDLSQISETELMRIAATPSAALGSTRDKPDEAYRAVLLDRLAREGTDAFIYIGGNDTAGTQQLLADASGGGIAFVHAPKTIDNDLTENDHTPGFISAGGFVAASFLSVDLDFRALPGIYVGIVMGRHAGFLTAAASAWRMDEASGPHLTYVPERPFTRERFVSDLREVHARHGRCIVAMSEGVVDTYGRPLVESLVPAEMLERDAHGNIRLSGGDLGQAVERMIGEALPGVRARVDTLGYLPRGHIGMVSPVDQAEAFDAGRFAVEAAAQGSGSVALTIAGGRTVPSLVRLDKVAGLTRTMPDEFLVPEENRLAPEALRYLERLIPRQYDPAIPFA